MKTNICRTLIRVLGVVSSLIFSWSVASMLTIIGLAMLQVEIRTIDILGGSWPRPYGIHIGRDIIIYQDQPLFFPLLAVFFAPATAISVILAVLLWKKWRTGGCLNNSVHGRIKNSPP